MDYLQRRQLKKIEATQKVAFKKLPKKQFEVNKASSEQEENSFFKLIPGILVATLLVAAAISFGKTTTTSDRNNELLKSQIKNEMRQEIWQRKQDEERAERIRVFTSGY